MRHPTMPPALLSQALTHLPDKENSTTGKEGDREEFIEKREQGHKTPPNGHKAEHNQHTVPSAKSGTPKSELSYFDRISVKRAKSFRISDSGARRWWGWLRIPSCGLLLEANHRCS